MVDIAMCCICVLTPLCLRAEGKPLIDLLAHLALAGFGRWAWKSNRKRNDPEIRPNKPVLTNVDDSAEL